MVTIILTVSRDTFLQRVFASLDFLDVKSDQVNLLTYVDGGPELYLKARNFTMNARFKDKLCITRKHGDAHVGSMRLRRQRIADIHNEIKPLINNCDYVLVVEDDTVIPANTIKKLLDDMAGRSSAGFVSGVQIGRWGYNHIGAWKVDDIYNTKKVTSMPVGKDVESADAAGLYCCLIKKDVYLNHTFSPFEDVLGPDVNFGISLRQQGYQNYVDFSLKCKHLDRDKKEIKTIDFINTKVIQVEFTKEADKWFLKTL